MQPINQARPIRDHLFTLGFLISMVGLVVSRGMMSIGMIIMVANAVIHPEVKRHLGIWLSRPAYWMPSLVFVVYLLSGLWSADSTFWLNKTIQKLPLVLLPLAFAAWQPDRRTYHFLLFALFAMMVLVSAGVLVNFAMHYREVVDNYLHAKTIATPFNHIRYSLLAAFTVGSGIYLFLERDSLPWKWARPVLLVGTLFLFVFLHILSVRSGLLAVYLVLAYVAVRYIILQRRWTIGLLLLAALLAVPVAAYYTVPTFHNKAKYMFRDLNVYQSGKDFQDFSDGRRLVSLRAGVAVGMANPLLGAGIGDVPAAVAAYYAEHYPALPVDRYPLPHNQFIYWFAGLGAMGLLVCTLALVWPLFVPGVIWHLPFGAINMVMWSSFLSEATLETQLGVSVMALFYLLTFHGAIGNKWSEQLGSTG